MTSGIQKPGKFVSFEIDGATFALPATEVREIIPCPPLVTKVPSGNQLLVGFTHLRGPVLLVIDIRPLFAREGSGAAERQPEGDQTKKLLAVVAYGHSHIGLMIDAVGEVFSEEQAALTDESGPLVRGQFLRDERIIQVLNCRQLPIDNIPRSDLAQTVKGEKIAPLRKAISFRAGGLVCAFAITDVVEIRSFPSAMDTSQNLQTLTARGLKIPLVDFSRLIDQNGATGAIPLSERRILIMRHDGHHFGLIIDGLDDLVPFHDASLNKKAVDAPCFHGRLFQGTLPLDGRDIFLLKADQLAATYVEVAQAVSYSQATNAHIKHSAAGLSQKRAETFVIINLGGPLALPILDIKGVLDCPPLLAHPPGLSDAFCGLIEVRGESIPLIDVRRQCGAAAADPAQRKVLLFHYEQATYGALVDGLEQIVKATTHDASVTRALSVGISERLLAFCSSAIKLPDTGSGATKVILVLSLRTVMESLRPNQRSQVA